MARRDDHLDPEQVAEHLASCPAELSEIVHALRGLVLKTAPVAREAIRFNALCYFKPDCAYGVIGGNICMIDWRKGYVELAFIHGASLPDPERLLRLSGKAKRYIRIDSPAEARSPAVRAMIQAAVAYSPVEKRRARGKSSRSRRVS